MTGDFDNFAKRASQEKSILWKLLSSRRIRHSSEKLSLKLKSFNVVYKLIMYQNRQASQINLNKSASVNNLLLSNLS